MLIINLITAIALPMATAAALIRLIFRGTKLPVDFTLAASYAVGIGMVAIWMMLLAVIDAPLVWKTIGIPFIVLLGILLALNFSKRGARSAADLFTNPESPSIPNELNWAARITLALFYLLAVPFIIFTVFYVFWRSLTLPVYTWDAIATAAFKAKIFFYKGAMVDMDVLPHANYPLFIPFIEAWIAMCLGQWHEQYVKIVFPFAHVSFLMLSFVFPRSYTNRAWAALGLVLLCSSNMFNHHGSISYRDFFVMYYACLGIMFLLLWVRSRHAGFIWLAGFFAGVTSFVKVEGSAYALIVLVIAVYAVFTIKDMALKKKWWSLAAFSIPSLSILLTFHLYKLLFTSLRLSGNEEKEQINFVMSNLTLIPETFKAYFHNLFMLSNWGFVWLIFFLSLPHFFRRRKSVEIQVLLLSLVMFLGLYVAVAIGTASFRWLVGPDRVTGLSRIFLHFFPLAPLAIILANYEPRFLSAPRPAETLPQSPSPFKRSNKKNRNK